MSNETHYTAFLGFKRIASGDLETVLIALKHHAQSEPNAMPLVFDTTTGRQIDLDLSQPAEDLAAAAQSKQRSRGRPKMGVECSELCLLPRHWEWLASQKRSASATIRRLIDAARKAETPEDRLREKIDAAGTFLWAIAGDLPRFEEVSRALYRQEWQQLLSMIADWPQDVQEELRAMLEP